MKIFKTFLIIASLAITTLSHAAEVKVLKASSAVSNRLHDKTQNFNVLVVVENLGVNKNVTMMVKRLDGSWKEFPAEYKYTISASQQAWAVSGSDPYGVTQQELKFAVKYEVNGNTFIDDNNGSLYTVEPDGGEYVNTNLLESFADLTQAKLALSSLTLSFPKHYDNEM